MSKNSVLLDRDRLTALRKRDCLSQQELAAKADLSKGSVENAENGKAVSLPVVVDLAAVFQVRPFDLFHETEREALNFLESIPDDRVGNAPQMPGLLVGRSKDLRAVRANLLRQRVASQLDGQRATLVIGGWAGVGKTTLTKAIAHDGATKATFKNGLLWTSLGQNPSTRSTLKSWLDALNLTANVESTDRELSERIGGYLADREVLVIIDDVWDAKDVSHLLIGGSSCATVLTTRISTVADNLSSRPDDIYKLEVLTEDDAVELLECLAPNVVKHHEKECRRLAQDVEFLPLALQVAGRLLRIEYSRTGDVHKLFDQLRSEPQQALMEADVPADVYGLVGDKAQTVQALLRFTTDLLDDATRDRFAYLGAIAEKPAIVSTSYLAGLWQVDDATPTISSLLDFGLIERVKNDRFQIHAVLKAHAQSLCED